MNTMRTENDAELIKAYVERDDQGAFAEIVSRHGSMVYRVCFRKLLNRHDAEDASQAVFMALIKKSKQMQWQDSLACWLYSVARQTALFMARTRARREHRESAAMELLDAESHPQVTAQDRESVLKFLDNELAALSYGQREAVILRYLDGLSEKDAALAAGCAPHTLTWRARNGISNLRKRLVRRSCALAVPALVGVLEADAQAAIPQTLIPSLLAVPKLAAAGATAGTASANITMLMEGALKTMAIAKIKTVGIGIIVALLIGTTGVVAVKEVQKNHVPDTREVSVAIPVQSKKPDTGKSTDQTGISSKETKSSSTKIFSKSRDIQSDDRDFQAEAEKVLKEDNAFNLKGIIKAWFDKYPVAAKEWAMQLPEGKDRDVALNGVAAAWATKNSVAAAKWAQQLPEGDGKNAALKSVANAWFKEDSVAAAKWAQQLPEGDGKNGVLAILINQSKNMDNLVYTQFPILVKANPAAAKKWLEQSSLPQAEKDRLLKEAEKK